MSLHHIIHEIHFMILRLGNSHGTDLAVACAVIIFAVVFLLVGATRVVEFQNLGLTPVRRKVFTVFHHIGCFLIFVAMVLFALDTQRSLVPVNSSILAAALILLMPIHIYVGLRRRIILRDAMKDS